MLQISGLRVNYAKVQALHGVDIAVRKGEIAAIIGANGAGKTTTLNAVLRLVPWAAGEITFDGRSLKHLRSHQMIRVGLGTVLEGRQLFSDQSVEDNLLLGAYGLGRRSLAQVKENIERELKRFPILASRRRQLAGTLSGGEQQMLALARAMVADPKMLLLDEPTMGLAPVIIKEVVKTISDLRARGLTILWVEQMAYVALQIADRVYILENGRIVREGKGQELLNDSHVIEAYLGA
ncbi:MAG TPA: ABC transporter ATP-binding protein [Thermodesulfobacteriota bacterium]|nr:ABC transporter ATP-binding protein [Thermodesulfobacteriota bacterium]